jgi:hypothetical protein
VKNVHALSYKERPRKSDIAIPRLKDSQISGAVMLCDATVNSNLSLPTCNFLYFLIHVFVFWYELKAKLYRYGPVTQKRWNLLRKIFNTFFGMGEFRIFNFPALAYQIDIFSRHILKPACVLLSTY